MTVCGLRRIVVLKLGGSVLVDDDSYRKAARFLVRRFGRCNEERLVVVVSARKGITDDLQRLGRNTTPYPSSRTLDLLWSTGEIHSVAFLTLHLEELGVSAVGLNIHETGLRWDGSLPAGTKVEALCGELRRAFDDHSVVVVPGFFATLANGTVVSLGRGGSDLSAVLLAAELGAQRCELIKDVAGYFTQDPNIGRSAEHIPSLSYEKALGMADAGCCLVQPKALEAARAAGLQLIVRSLHEVAPVTVVLEDAAGA